MSTVIAMISTVLILLNFEAANAQSSTQAQDAARTRDRLTTSIRDWESSQASFDSQLTRTDQRLTALRTRLNNTPELEGPSFFQQKIASWSAYTDTSRLERDLAAQNARLQERARIEEDIRKLEAEREVLARNRNNVTTNLRNDRNSLQAANETLASRERIVEAALKDISLAEKYDGVYKRFEDVNDMLDRISRNYDQQMIGAYIYQKIKNELNGDAICASVNQCENGKRKPNSGAKIEPTGFTGQYAAPASSTRGTGTR